MGEYGRSGPGGEAQARESGYQVDFSWMKATILMITSSGVLIMNRTESAASSFFELNSLQVLHTVHEVRETVRDRNQVPKRGQKGVRKGVRPALDS